MTQKFYISTAIHYVNDVPHIGHMYENIVADVIARHRRRMGDDVWFLTGTDEHGQRIERSAAKQGILPIELADRVVADHHRLWKKLNISYDDFIRTTEARHRVGVHELIRRMVERNPDDIYLGEFEGWYCPNDETYFTDKEITDAKCPNGHPLERTREQNYFFRLSRYQPLLLDFYKKNPGFVQPQTRFNEVIAFVESGLRDLSVSRTTIRWGVPWPGNPDHVIYVWLDALTNYISALGFGSGDHKKFDRYWPADLHLIGKDIIRFHTVYWPAFLMSAGVELPKRVYGHGWWLRDNQKISKSVGNIVRPENIIDDFGTDPFRYFVLREMVFGQDQNYSDEAFVARYNADLANDLGNTMSRALKMSESYFGGKTPPTPCDDNDLLRAARELTPEYLRAMDEYAFQRALENTWRLLVAINGYIVAKEPWKMHKEKGADEALSRVIWNALEALRIVWVMLAPFMPSLTRDALARLGSNPDQIGVDALQWGGLPNNVPIRVGESIFPRIDTAAYIGGSMSNPPIETTQAAPPDLAKVTIDQFMEIDLRVAEIRAAEKVEKSKKLIKLTVFDGEGERTLVAGIATRYAPEELVGRKVVIVANLQPAKLMGIESNGMVLAASISGEPSLLSVDASVPAGTKVK
ncbi:MAG TPA: methionine--tRNA ligase [Thermoanaerobaculia bacterium]